MPEGTEVEASFLQSLVLKDCDHVPISAILEKYSGEMCVEALSFPTTSILFFPHFLLYFNQFAIDCVREHKLFSLTRLAPF